MKNANQIAAMNHAVAAMMLAMTQPTSAPRATVRDTARTYLAEVGSKNADPVKFGRQHGLTKRQTQALFDSIRFYG